MKHLDSFCNRHPGFGIPNLMLAIAIGNSLVWVLTQMDGGKIFDLLYFSPQLILQGQVWRLISFIFIPATLDFWIFVMLYFYYFVGSALERQWGCAKLTIYYFIGLFITVASAMIIYFAFNATVYISAMYLLYPLLFAFAFYYGEGRAMLFFIIPIKMRWLAIFGALTLAFNVVTLPFPDNIIPIVSVLNFALFFGHMIIGGLNPANNTRRKTRKHFNNEIHRIKWEERNKDYTRKCEACGKTDVSHPELEFRFCSRCEGYHCFCIDHINSHEHIKLDGNQNDPSA